MNVVTLRPPGLYSTLGRRRVRPYSEWARWFWKGAVHIDDVAAAVILGQPGDSCGVVAVTRDSRTGAAWKVLEPVSSGITGQSVATPH